MKALFIFPPLWCTYSISTGIPPIMGFLEKHGYSNIEALDLNIKFFQYYCKKEKLQKLFENLKTESANKIQINDDKNKFFKLYIKKYKALQGYISKKNQEKILYETINQIEDVVKKYKSNNLAEKYSEFKISQTIFNNVQELIRMLLYEHSILNADSYLTIINNIECNPYKEFFSEISDKIIEQNYDYIGFSINSPEQSIATLILTKMLRKKGIKSHICYGGSDTHFLKSVVLKNMEYFDNYIDTLMLGAGEHPTLELFEYIEGKRKRSDVTNIIYKNEKGEIKENKVKQILGNEFVVSSYKGYDFKEYTLPESVIPIRTSFGCYWGKCTFCNYNSITKFEQRSVDSVTDEIKYYIKNYNVNNFYFVDAALSPKFLREFSKKIRKENLEIYYFTNLRFEKDFTKEFLTQLYETGLRCCGWGLESASPRILKLMRKGIEIENVKQILKNSHEIGLINHLYLIVGFPTETIKDFDMTCDFIKNNMEYIDSIAHHYFHITNDSYIFSHPKEFNITPEFLERRLGIISGEKRRYYDYKISKLNDEIIKKNKLNSIEEFLIRSKIKNTKLI